MRSGTRSSTNGLGRSVWVLVLGVMDFSLEQAIVVPVLPAMGAEYDAPLTSVAWVITGFLIAAAIATPLAGRFGDQFGKRRVILASLGLFACGSLLCAAGSSIGVVVTGRVVQGLGAGVGPLAVALARDLVDERQLPRAVGLLIGAGGLGGTIGFLVAGPLVDHVSVSSIFWLLVVIAVLLGAAVVFAVPESSVRSRTRIDWLGGVLLAGALGAGMLVLSQGNAWGWLSMRTLALAAGSVVLSTLFVAREWTAAEPLFDPSGLGRRPVWAAQLSVFAVGLGLFVAYLLVPQIGALPTDTGYGLGLTTTEIALVLLPGAVGALGGGLVGGRLVAAIGARAQAVAGVALAAFAYVLFVVLEPSTALLATAMVPLGVGIGLALTAIVDLVVLSADQSETGAAMGLNSVLRAIGSAIGAALAAAILAGGAQIGPGIPSERAFTVAFLMGLGATLLALASLFLIPARSLDPVLRAATVRES